MVGNLVGVVQLKGLQPLPWLKLLRSPFLPHTSRALNSYFSHFVFVHFSFCSFSFFPFVFALISVKIVVVDIFSFLCLALTLIHFFLLEYRCTLALCRRQHGILLAYSKIGLIFLFVADTFGGRFRFALGRFGCYGGSDATRDRCNGGQAENQAGRQ